MEIERYIPEGREHAISRKELRALLGRHDRLIREWIKQANRRLEPEGKVILSSSSWRGYWISSDPEEIAAYLQEQGSRARTQAKNDEPARRLLARLRGEKIIRVRSYLHPGQPLRLSTEPAPFPGAEAVLPVQRAAGDQPQHAPV